jgi:hypothetical protein
MAFEVEDASFTFTTSDGEYSQNAQTADAISLHSDHRLLLHVG